MHSSGAFVPFLMRFLSEVWGYKEEDIVMLTDDASNPRQIPTRDKIVSKRFTTTREVPGTDIIATATGDAMARTWRPAQ